MSTISASPSPAWTATRSLIETRSRRREAWIGWAAGSAVLLVAAGLRFWGVGTTFESSDQAGLAHAVLFGRGIRWILAHGYGPVLPTLHKIWSEAAFALGFGLTEAVFRSLVALMEVAQVLVTGALLRRLGCSRRQALAGMLCVAVLPSMVSNAHFVWNHVGTWLLMGTIALWATLAYLDDRKRWQLAVAAAALMCHCLSSAIALGLPLVLLVLWFRRWRQGPQGTAAGQAGVTTWECAVGFVLPCTAALVIIFGSWLWTGGGQIGHLIARSRFSNEGLRWHQLGYIPGTWLQLFGYVFAVVAAAGLIRATLLMGRAATTDRRGLLAMWAWCGLIPFTLIANWDRIGSPESYVIEPVFCGGVLGMLALCEWHGRLAARPHLRAGVAVFSVLAVGHLAFSTVDACLAGERWTAFTGASANWGRIWPDTGIKATGWYIRRHVPENAVLLSLHTNQGMEVPVAEYYTGRKMLACEDLPAGGLDELARAMREHVDAIIVPAGECERVERFREFERVCTIRQSSRPVRFIYARSDRQWPRLDAEADALNRLYDGTWTRVRQPLAIPAGEAYLAAKDRYKAVVARLKTCPTGRQ